MMSNKYSIFKFKKFSLQQVNAAMKIGTDGILLGAWMNLNNKTKLLDIGTGTGVIALMQAQKSSSIKIDAIEIDAKACIDAKANFINSPWKNRLTLYNCNLENYSTPIKYDVIVSNPPFFENSLKANSQERTLARHNSSLHYTDIFNFCVKNLNENGSLNLILPKEQQEKCILKAEKIGLALIRKCNVFPNATKQQHRTLFEFSFTKRKLKEETITIELDKRHHYTNEYKELTKDFYIIF